ncbi:cell division cycle and apoptosis regulator protein 1 isoform X1 [Callorhinchus milii]|uniref:cell division cycle and apoptosis regulator protein 1 isoform X1 n=1 Tax=Callorhinchus milii TaxID=7868 RepID=UPI001C3F8C27|nr:cell division cycle and apoptosis regulator protein 1 isoform X1 [Callorhinchus milii]
MWGSQFQSSGTKAVGHGGQSQSLLGPRPQTVQELNEFCNYRQGHGQTGQQQQQQQPGQSQKQRVFTGVVTSLHDYYGFVDEEVFFHQNVVKGRVPQVGERVLVKAVYNPSHSVQWNALKVQVQPSQVQKHGILGTKPPPQPLLHAPRLPSLMSSQPQPLLPRKGGLLQPLVHMGAHGQMGRRMDVGHRMGGRNGRMEMGQNRRGDRRNSYKRGGVQGLSQKRYQDMGSGEGPAKKVRHYVPPYSVQYSRFSLGSQACDAMDVQRRYPNLPFAEEFFNAQLCFTDTFPLGQPLQLGQKCVFHIMEEGDQPTEPQGSATEPDDADPTYSAKVLLLSCPDLEELYRQGCCLAETSKEEIPQHPARLLKFLVGTKGQEGTVAIGGPWSPSCDGPNPGKDPKVLIRTAIRTTKALTGIDLSACTQWFRFAEICYYQPEEHHDGRPLPAHVETSVVFLPDVWHCLPTRLEWESLTLAYKQQLSDTQPPQPKDATGDEAEENMEVQADDSRPTPTLWSQLEPKTMKVDDIAKELQTRGLSSKGTKLQLVTRLERQLREEEEDAEAEEALKEDPAEEVKTEDTEEEKEDEQKEMEQQAEGKQMEDSDAPRKPETVCRLPAEPAVIVNPNRAAMDHKFGCIVMSLQRLRNYRNDSMTHSFEVLLLAELFGEMLQRDFGYTIYKALLAFPGRKLKPEKPEEEGEGQPAEKEKSSKKGGQEEVKEPKERTSKSLEMKENEEQEEDWDWEETKLEDGESKGKEVKGKRGAADSEAALLEMDEALLLEDNEEEFAGDEEKKLEGKRATLTETELVKEMEKDVSQMVTLKKDLLLAFVYFDRNLCGYVLEKDLEMIICTVGLHLSRAQIKQLLSKVASQNTCLYRTLTDGWEGDLEKLEDKSLISEELLLGNKHLISHCAGVVVSKPAAGSSKTRARRGDSGLVEHNGTLVNVGNLVQKLERDERNRADMETRLRSMELRLDEALGEASSKDKANKSLTEDKQERQKKLAELEERVKAAEKLKAYYESQLQDNSKHLTSLVEDIQRLIKKNNAAAEKKK